MRNGRMTLERVEVVERIRWLTLERALRESAPRAEPPYAPGGRSLIAVIDSGLNPHQEIPENRIVARYNAIDGSDSVADETGHGTAIAGILAGSGSPGAGHGIATAARLVIVKVGAVPLEDGFKSSSIPTSMIIRALKWIAAERAGIESRIGGHLGAVCLATAGGPLMSQPHAGWRFSEASRAVLALADAGVLTVVGAGNSHHIQDEPTEGMHWPAILPACVSVGATYDQDFNEPPRSGKVDELTYYTNRILSGPHQTTLFAPGSVTRTTSRKGPAALEDMEGTSSATPVVCASVILAQELQYLRHGRWPTSKEVVDLFTRSARVLTELSTQRTYRLLNLEGVAGDALMSVDA